MMKTDDGGVLDRYFDRIVVIAMPGRGERALLEMARKGLSLRAQEVRAVDGRLVTPPAWWEAGGPAWGCHQSHYRAVQDALMDGVESLLLLEDDVTWQADPVPWVEDFMSQVPQDWGQIYFGGQHRQQYRPRYVPGKPAVMRLSSIHRTHAYAIHRRIMPQFLRHIVHAPDYMKRVSRKDKPSHVDHQMEVAHRRGDWPVYGPSWWLAGQAENQSTIRNRPEPERWWQWTGNFGGKHLPLVVSSRPMSCLHFGRHLDREDASRDVGLLAMTDPASIRQCMEGIAAEAAADQKLPAVHPQEVTLAALADWPGGVWHAEEVGEERLRDRADPFAHPFAHRWLHPTREAAAVSVPVERPIFVFSAPRSGSTLLMRILAGVPGVKFGGEAADFWWRLKGMEAFREDWLREFPGAEEDPAVVAARGGFPGHYWPGAAEGWRRAVRDLAKARVGASPGCVAWGWKETGIGKLGGGEELFRWIHTVFPEAHLVFLLRDVEKVLVSMAGRLSWFIPQFAGCMGEAERLVKVQQASFAAYAAEEPGRTSLLDYDTLVGEFPEWARAELGLEVPEDVFRRELALRVR